MSSGTILRIILPRSLTGLIWYSVILSWIAFTIVSIGCGFATGGFSLSALLSGMGWGLYAIAVLALAAGCAVLSLRSRAGAEAASGRLFNIGAGFGFYVSSMLFVGVTAILGLVEVASVIGGETPDCETAVYKMLFAPLLTLGFALVGIPLGIAIAVMSKRRNS